MKNLIREFLFLRKGERRALVILAFALLCSISIRIWVEHKSVPKEELNPEYLAKMREIQDEIQKQKKLREKQVYTNTSVKKVEKSIVPFVFDPNTISRDSLRLMNISEYVIDNIDRYRKAGGQFASKEELKKIYGLENAVYETLLPYIMIHTSKNISESHIERYLDTLPLIELNEADSVQLIAIPGIGPSYSRRILKYRSILGGYHHFDQLWSVYGMDTVRIEALRKYIIIDTSKITQIPINSASFREIVSHPYIDKPETYAILQYRDFVDSIQSIFELENNQIIDHDRFIRMLPYLCLNETNY